MNYVTDPMIAPYKIGIDENQFELLKVCIAEKGNNIGKPYDLNMGYFASFQGVLGRLIILLVNDASYDSIHAYLNACREKHFVLMNGFAEYLNREKWQNPES